MSRDLSIIERTVLRAYETDREPIGDSDLDDDQPVTLLIRTTLGDLRRLHSQAFEQASRSPRPKP